MHGNGTFVYYAKGFGSGLWSGNNASMSLEGCTVAGNGSAYGAASAVHSNAGSLVVSNSVIWGNDNGTPGVLGTNATVSFSDIQGGWAGPGTGNIDQDPGFVDLAGGNLTLTSGSACIDAGDPAAAPTGLDLGGHPRLLDGDLDRSLRVDMGAHEFSHVRLDVSGEPTPGGTITLSSTGTAGMELFLAVGSEPGETLLDPLGSVFFSLMAPVRVMRLGVIPNSTDLVIPVTISPPVSVVLQELAIGSVLPSGRRPGNLSNPVFLTVE